jgi:hypothetical protein
MASRCCSAPRSRAASKASRSTVKSCLKVVDVVDGDWQAADVIVHDVTNRSIAHMLVEMPFGAFPMALGVLYDDPRAELRGSDVVAQNAQGIGRARRPICKSCYRQGPDLDGRPTDRSGGCWQRGQRAGTLI